MLKEIQKIEDRTTFREGARAPRPRDQHRELLTIAEVTANDDFSEA